MGMGIDTYTVNHWNEATHAHEPSILTIEQNFAFDALGFLVLPQLLSQAELSACRGSGDGLGDLCSEAGTVGRYVRELCGDGFRQDGPARHVPAAALGRVRRSLAATGRRGPHAGPGIHQPDGVEWPQRRRNFAFAGRRRLGRGPHPAVPGAGGGHRPHGLRRRQVPAGGRALLAQERAACPTASILQPLRRAPGAGGGRRAAVRRQRAARGLPAGRWRRAARGGFHLAHGSATGAA